MSICIREPLTADRTYYVRTDGNDSNSGLENTAGGAFLTIQKAVDVVDTQIDIGTFNVVIQVDAGSYTQNIFLRSYLGIGNVTLRGDVTTPANVSITVSSGRCISSSTSCSWKVEGFTVSTTGSGNNCIHASGGGASLVLGVMRFGSAIGAHVNATSGGVIFLGSSYSITGGALQHVCTDFNGTITFASGITATLTGTPAFSSSFAYAIHTSGIGCSGVTWSGAATGVRYRVSLNACIDTNGGGANYFPGNSAGVITSGGQYA